MQETGRVAASFRDPSGFVFREAGGVLLRQVNPCYGPQYDQLMSSGLYARLTAEGLLVSHDEVSLDRAASPGAVRVIAPTEIPFVSYPYEWCAAQLREAALLTLQIQIIALEFGQSLKDASAYNVQFVGARPVFIDTLSFEPYREGSPWVAYGQFCRHFLAPLALMHYGEPGIAQLLRAFIDGIPLPLASRALPWRSRLKPGLLMHLHWLARAERAAVDTSDAEIRFRSATVSRRGLLGILDNLQSTVRTLAHRTSKTTWGNYYAHTNYSTLGAKSKETRIRDYLDRIKPATVWDLGANTGVYSALAAASGAMTVALDFDHAAVDALYRRERATPCGLLPLVMDLANPSPALGWANSERDSLLDRGPADCVMALALIHHVCIGNNVPLENAAAFFARVCRHLIIEFVPREDSMVDRMLMGRKNQFVEYSQQHFEAVFGDRFVIEAQHMVEDTQRTLYLMMNRNAD